MSLNSSFLVAENKRVRLADYDPASTGGFNDEDEAQKKMREDGAALAYYQDKLLAQETYALLLIFQAMDGAGKDGTIKHVMSNVDPNGCTVVSLSQPAGNELKHDYLRRWVEKLPERGRIGIFNRSYYEEVLATRVHPERLDEHNLPPAIKNSKNIWKQRYRQINNFEQYLVENGILVMKFFLHLSKEKQKERILERLEAPDKKWKFSANDVKERGYWNEYMKAFEDALSHTSTRRAPWHIIPADHRWFSALAVTDLVQRQLKSLKLRYPQLTAEEKKESEKARKQLERE